MVYQKRLNRWGLTPPLAYMDTVYISCNFARPNPVDKGGGEFDGERIFPGNDTPRTFRRCNLVNVRVPPGSTIDRCNTAVRYETETEVIVEGRIDPETGEFIARRVVIPKDLSPPDVSVILTQAEHEALLEQRSK